MKSLFGKYLGYLIAYNMPWMANILLLMREEGKTIVIYTIRLFRIFNFMYTRTKVNDNVSYHGFEFVLYKLGFRVVFSLYKTESRLIRFNDGSYAWGVAPRRGYDA